MPYLPDDPIIHCIERTGYPPWYFYPSSSEDDDDFDDGEMDDYYGNESDSF